MSTYIDGYVIPIPKNNLRAYKKMAKLGCKTWMKYGALAYFECVADDTKAPYGINFPQMCKAKKKRNGDIRVRRIQIEISSQTGQCKSAQRVQPNARC